MTPPPLHSHATLHLFSIYRLAMKWPAAWSPLGGLVALRQSIAWYYFDWKNTPFGNSSFKALPFKFGYNNGFMFLLHLKAIPLLYFPPKLRVSWTCTPQPPPILHLSIYRKMTCLNDHLSGLMLLFWKRQFWLQSVTFKRNLFSSNWMGLFDAFHLLPPPPSILHLSINHKMACRAFTPFEAPTAQCVRQSGR